MGRKCYYILICISLVITGIEHLFMCYLDIFLGEMSIWVLWPFFKKKAKNFFKKFYLAALSLHWHVQAFSVCSEQGLLFVAVHRPLIVVASLMSERGL